MFTMAEEWNRYFISAKDMFITRNVENNEKQKKLFW